MGWTPAAAGVSSAKAAGGGQTAHQRSAGQGRCVKKIAARDLFHDAFLSFYPFAHLPERQVGKWFLLLVPALDTGR